MGTNVVFEEERIQIQERKQFSYSNFVTPFITYFHWTLCTPFQIKYEQESSRYFYNEGSCIYKILAILWQSLQFLYIFWGCYLSPVYDSDATGSAKFLHRLTYIFYAVYQTIWLNLMWRSLKRTVQIFNQGNTIYTNILSEIRLPPQEDHFCCSKGKKISCMRTISFTFLGLLSVFSTFSFLRTLMSVDLPQHDRYELSFFIHLDNFVNKTTSSFCRIGTGKVICVIHDTEYHRCASYILTLAWLIIIMFCETTWQISVYMMAGWALYFKKLLALIIKQIRRAESYEEIVSATKLFAQISLLVEEFNGIFGCLLLATLMDGILYKTITFAILFGGYSPGVEYMRAPQNVPALASLLLPSCIMLYIMADVHKMGSTVPNILKRKYVVENGGGESEPLTVGQVHLSLVAHNDILFNNIGFKGSGFFTISFAFVGSIIGITITYTVVMLEFTDKSA